MQPTIVVRGEASLEVPPELAVFSVSVTVHGHDRSVVVAKLAKRADELRAALDAYGDAIERRATGNVRVHPEFQSNSMRPSGYSGVVETSVTVADFDTLEEMLPRLAVLDQVSIYGPWWRLRPGSTAGAEVRRAAIADALGRAREYAAAVGARVDRLVEMSDEAAGGMAVMAEGFAGARSAQSTPVLQLDPQPQTVHASVLLRVTITEPDLSE
jgi:uncharacterized protein YggE